MRRGLRFLIAIVIAIGALITYFTSTEKNPTTGETQRVAMTVDQEIALGLQAAPQMAAEFQGEIETGEAAETVKAIGQQLVRSSIAKNSPYKYDFHLLADPQTVNAFALPGGQIFITMGLLKRLSSEGEIAGVLGHEIGHVIERHSNEHMAQQKLSSGLTSAAVIAAYDPDNPMSSASKQAVIALVAQMINLKYSRNDELESDTRGVEIMTEAGYDPRALIRVMKVLEEAAGRGAPEFMNSHPAPGNRVEKIEAAIHRIYPNGVPGGLKQ